MAKPAAMSFKKSSSALVDLFGDLAPNDPSVQQRKMFGWPCCFVNGNLFFGLHKESIIFRLSEGDREEFLQHAGASEFEPMPGRKMKGFVAATGVMLQDHEALSKWIARSLEHGKEM